VLWRAEVAVRSEVAMLTRSATIPP
jgi:hypothetical protein